MAQPVIQTSFNAGEWAPALNARVDLTKYHTGAALLRNFFVDYRGGATFRAGTRYVIQCKDSNNPVRLIPFQASFSVSYMLEFGQGYIRFINNGAPVLEAAKTITNINPTTGTFTSNAHGYSAGDWIFITGVVGTVGAAVNGNYYIIQSPSANNFGIGDLNGVPQTFVGLAYTSGGTTQRIYTVVSPYQGSEVFGIRYAQNANIMVICHPNYPPYQLILTTATSWAITAINFGATIGPPSGQSVTTTLGAGIWNYGYAITSVDINGQESIISSGAALASTVDLRSTAGTNTITWSPVTGAISYNVYKAEQRASVGVPAGAALGFIGNCTGTTFIDSNINPDFSQGPPVSLNPFTGSGVQSITITGQGSYGAGTVPTATLSGGGGSGANVSVICEALAVTGINSGGAGYAVGDTINLAGGIVVQVTSAPASQVNAINLIARGVFGPGGVFPTNPISQSSTSGIGSGATFSFNYRVASVLVVTPGTSYSTPPAVNFTAGGPSATATSVLGTPSSGNPTVPSFFQQRLVLAGPVASPQQFNMSTVAAPYNFNVHNPVEDDDAIQATLISNQLNTIQSLIPQPQGLIALTDKSAWLLNGGSAGSAVTPAAIVGNAHSHNGASILQPIVINDNILYVQSKNSIVRDLTYNFYVAIYTGQDISVLSSHLFYGFTIVDWARAEEPFKLVWAIRNDGILLCLTFLKEQELIAWSHSDTSGFFRSIGTITETVPLGSVDAVYTVVQRVINGNTVQYIERMTELYYPTGVTDGWNVDAGIQFNGTSALTFTGAQHLVGATVTGLATDNLGNVTVITPFAMPTTGTFTLPAPAAPATGYTRVTIGLGYIGQLQTLPLDLGEPTVQGKRKKITGVTARVKDTLGLTVGRNFTAASQKAMKDLVVGNIGTMSNQLVTGLVTGDARIIIDPLWDVPGQYCIQQSNPYPASILGVIPEIEIGDTK